MDQLGRVLVLMSANHGDSAPSHTALRCVHLTPRKNKKLTIEVVALLKDVAEDTVVCCISPLVDYSVIQSNSTVS